VRVFVLFFILVCSCAASLDEVDDIVPLGSGSFAERERAMRDLEDWVLTNQGEAKGILLKQYLRCADPEVRVRLLDLLERSYFPLKGFVGITMRSVLWDQLGRFQNGKTALGVRVTNVGKGTPAAVSGLKVDDILLSINGWEVKGGVDVTSLVAEQIQQNSPTTPVSLMVQRGDEVLTIDLKLGILPVASARARTLREVSGGSSAVLPADLQLQISDFQKWLSEEIEKDRKNLIADRRL